MSDRITVRLKEKEVEMLPALTELFNFDSDSETVRFLIRSAYLRGIRGEQFDEERAQRTI